MSKPIPIMQERGAVLKKLVEKQANDDGLWFKPETASEAYLMQELRKLHEAAEDLYLVVERVSFRLPGAALAGSAEQSDGVMKMLVWYMIESKIPAGPGHAIILPCPDDPPCKGCRCSESVWLVPGTGEDE